MPPSAASADAQSLLPQVWERAIRAAVRAIDSADEDAEWTRVVQGVTLSLQDGIIHYSFGNLEGELSSTAEEIRDILKGLMDNGNIPKPEAATAAVTPAGTPVAEAQAKMTGNDWIAIAITRASTKESIVQITSALTKQNLKSYFGDAASKKHGLWTIDNRTYSLTDMGRKRVTDLLNNPGMVSILDEACASDKAGGDENDKDDGEAAVPTAKPATAKPTAKPTATPFAAAAADKRPVAAAASTAAATDNEDSVSSLLARLDEQITGVDAETEEMVEYSKVYKEIEKANNDASKERIAYLVAKHVANNPIDVSEAVQKRTAPLQTARDELARAAKAAVKAIGAPPPAKKSKSE